MSDLISTPPAPASPQGSKVATGAFWPDIDLGELRAGVNLGGTVISEERLRAAVIFAVSEVTGELADWLAAQLAAGHAEIGDVDPDRTIDNRPELELLFLRAVTMHAAAELADRHLDLTATPKGADRQEERRDMADDFRRSAVRAIRAIIGTTGTMVDLV